MSSRRIDITDVNQRVDLASMHVLGDFLFVEMIERGESPAGIIIPIGERTACKYGKVLKKGTGVVCSETGEVIPLDYKIGDLVLFMDYAGERIFVEGGKYRMIREHGIWAKIEMDLSKKSHTITAVHPVTDHIMVKFPDTERTLSGVLELPGNTQTKCKVAEVVEVGPGMRSYKTGVLTPSEVMPGQRVITGRFSGANVFIGKQEYRLCNHSDVVAIIEGQGSVDILAGQKREWFEDQSLKDELSSQAQLEDMEARGLISRG